ncbi:MAG TPA: hypothetical protein EYH34_17415 [Planctomycetes bacterium]|nr:hypothetical protein [Planctomycetota bacterium]
MPFVYYLVTRNGTFLCRNHAFFASDVRAPFGPGSLAPHAEQCWVCYPTLSRTALELVVGFFDRVYRLYGGEAITLLFWDLRRQRYKLWVPDQQPTVWESASGYRTPTNVTCQAPVPPPENHLLMGDIHSHADLDAYASHQDRLDEHYRDGVHVVVGRIDEEPPQFHLEVAVASAMLNALFAYACGQLTYQEVQLDILEARSMPQFPLAADQIPPPPDDTSPA